MAGLEQFNPSDKLPPADASTALVATTHGEKPPKLTPSETADKNLPALKITDPVSEAHKHLEDLAKKAFPEKTKQKEFEANLKTFEQRATKQHLSEDQVAGTYDAIARMLEPNPQASVNDANRKVAALETLEHAAHPTAIDQGNHGTCTVASMESRIFTLYPASAAGLIAEVATSGEYTTKSGQSFIFVDQDNLSRLDSESKDNDLVDDHRSYASQLFQVTATNLYCQNVPPWNSYEQTKPTDSNDTGERLVSPNNKAQKVGSPEIPIEALGGISNMITGLDEKHFVLFNSSLDPELSKDKTSSVFQSQQEFKTTLENLAKDKKFPIMLAVNPNQMPFLQDENDHSYSDDSHIVTITGYEPKTGKVYVANEWGKDSNHLDGINLEKVYAATQPDKSAEATINKEVDYNKQHHLIGTYDELNSLRMQYHDGTINDQDFVNSMCKHIESAAKHWDEQEKHGEPLDAAQVNRVIDLLKTIVNSSDGNKTAYSQIVPRLQHNQAFMKIWTALIDTSAE